MRHNILDNREISAEVVEGKTCITITETITVDRFNFEQRFRTAAKLQGLSLFELAKRIGTTQSNLTVRIETGRFPFDEQREMAKALGCNLVIKNVFDDGTEIVGESKKQLIVDSCSHAKLSVSKLAEILKTSRQALAAKLERGKFSDEEMDDMANKIGCRYFNYFELDSGIAI